MLCYGSGLIYFDNPKQIFQVPQLIIFSVFNLYSLGFNFYVMTCPYSNCSYIDVQHAESQHADTNLSLLGLSPFPSKNYQDYQKFLFTFASFSGTASYFFMIFALNSNNLKSCCPCITKEVEGSLLSPFSDEFSLKKKQSSYFFIIFLVNIFVYLGSVVVFFTIFGQLIDRSDSAFHKSVDSLGLVSQFISWFCAILSCFIFSKVAYSVANICIDDLYRYLNIVASNNEIAEIVRGDSGAQQILKSYDIVNELTKCSLTVTEPTPLGVSYFSILKDVDQWYVKKNKASLRIYSFWFAIHWLMYTITAFMSITNVIQHIVRDMYGDNIECHGEQNAMCRLSLAYDLLFAISHCILFIYPCYRAATVTSSRNILINRISRDNWFLVPLEQKQAFLLYLNSEDCTFKVSILCASVTFGFNLAYFSIFAGIMSIILKISL